MFRGSRAHLQEDAVVHMQHMVLSPSMRVHGGLSIHSCVPTSHILLHVACSYVLLIKS
jgi:hypothetical protein